MPETPAKTESEIEGCAASFCYGVRPIANGFILTMPDETEVYCKSINEVGNWFSDRITEAFEEARHYEWDRKFQVQFNHLIL